MIFSDSYFIISFIANLVSNLSALVIALCLSAICTSRLNDDILLLIEFVALFLVSCYKLGTFAGLKILSFMRHAVRYFTSKPYDGNINV